MNRLPTILLVDDSPDDVALIRRALRRGGVEAQVETAADGLEAWQYLQACPAERLPSFVLLDLKMPRMNGTELLARVRAMEPTRLVPIIVFTSSNEETDVRESLERGANSFVQKPVDSKLFSSTVHALTHYWLAVNQRAAARPAEPPPAS